MEERAATAVKVRGLSKRFGEIEALREVDLDFPKGKLTSLLGPSGCGKTTLLKIIAGLIDADSGAVIIDGKTVNAPGPDRAARPACVSLGAPGRPSRPDRPATSA